MSCQSRQKTITTKRRRTRVGNHLKIGDSFVYLWGTLFIIFLMTSTSTFLTQCWILWTKSSLEVAWKSLSYQLFKNSPKIFNRLLSRFTKSMFSKLTKFERQLRNEMMPNLAKKYRYHDHHTVYQ